MEESDKAALEQLQPVQEVLRVLVIALGAMNPAAMPKAALAMRAATANGALSVAARVMLWDIADGIDALTGISSER